MAKSDGFGITWFVWDGLRMVQEQRGARCLTTVYEGAGSHVPLARVEHGADELEVGADQVFHFHADINGAPEELTSAHGRVVWRARYKTWGNTRLDEWESEYEQDPHVLAPRRQNLRFQGQYLDRETGLHYNTFRYYDPDIGRFISPAPIGLVGGINLYQYAPNSISWIDPWGWSGGPALFDTNLLVNAMNGNSNAMGAIASHDGRLTPSQYREFMNVSTSSQRKLRQRFLNNNNIKVINGNEAKEIVKNKDFGFVFETTVKGGHSRGDATLAGFGRVTGLPILTSEKRLSNFLIIH